MARGASPGARAATPAGTSRAPANAGPPKNFEPVTRTIHPCFETGADTLGRKAHLAGVDHHVEARA